MNIEVKQILPKFLALIEKLKKYTVVIFIVVVALVFGFLVLRIKNYSSTEPTEEAVTEKLTTVQRPKIDKNAISKIQQLEDQNVEVQSLFEQARDNPFSE